MKNLLLVVSLMSIVGCATKYEPTIITNEELQCRKSVRKIMNANNIDSVFDRQDLLRLCVPTNA